VRLIRHVTPVGRVLLVLTIAAAVAVVVVQDTATYLAVAAVCVAWITVYRAADPLHRKRWGDDPANDSTGWRDREL
jgi:hypothetical protein